MMDKGFLAIIDRNLARMGFSDRSAFLRQAALEKLGRSGVPVDVAKSVAPSRVGKGGRPANVEDFVPTSRVAETNEVIQLPPRKPTTYKPHKPNP